MESILTPSSSSLLPPSAMLAPSSSLLSPSESQAFQSFLSSISDSSSAGVHDWNLDVDVPNVPKDRQALAKATKDLMTLDQSHWPITAPNNNIPYHNHYHQQSSHLSLFRPGHSHSSSRTPTPTSAYPLYHSDLPPPSIKQSKRPRAHPYSVSPVSPSAYSHPHSYSYPYSYSQTHSVSQAHSHQQLRQPRSHSQSHPQPPQSHPQPPQAHPQPPRSHPQQSQPQSRPHSQPHSQSQSQPQHASQMQPRVVPSSTHLHPPPKPALLSASQKKANHIQSEQKRRANIRRGYEALCECVPALREAIREEEEANAERSGSGGVDREGKRKVRASIKGKDSEEKIDGRAGPRSENVVLSKTIDYINDLLAERSTLLARLHRARSSLPPGHPCLIPPRRHKSEQQKGGSQDLQGMEDHQMNGVQSYPNGSQANGDSAQEQQEQDDDCPLWEREWKGGHGKLGNIEEDGDESG